MPAVDHYENFPVASWLCPPHLRGAVVALYHFARTADDLADEGQAPPAERLADLAAFRAELHACAQGLPPSPRWAHVFGPLAPVLRQFQLPLPLQRVILRAGQQQGRSQQRQAAHAVERRRLELTELEAEQLREELPLAVEAAFLTAFLQPLLAALLAGLSHPLLCERHLRDLL